VHQLTGSFKSRGWAIKDGGTASNQPDAIKNRWMEYGSELYKKQQQYNYGTIADLKRRSCDEDEANVNNNILTEDVVAAVKKLKDSKSPEVDEIPAELIKAVGEYMISTLHQLLKCIWEKEHWPTEWMKSILVTIPKKVDLADCANYRTIAPISHFSTDCGLQINKKKSKVIFFKHDMVQINPIIVVDGEQLETLSVFVYLETLLTSNNDCTPEIKWRINLASQSVGMLKSLWACSEHTHTQPFYCSS